MKSKKLVIIMLSLATVVLVIGVVVFSLFYTKDATALGSDHVSTVTGDAIKNQAEDIPKLDYTYIPPTEEEPITSPTPVVTEAVPEPFVPATEIDLDPSSITVFINKEYALPKKYKPDNLVKPDIYFHMSYYDERTLLRSEAASSIEQLFLAANKDGIMLSGVSGYRSYARQYKIFTDNIVVKGKEHTLKYSAVPGTSEHQSGLAMDISCESLDYDLSSAFAETPEGKWVAENAHSYGFIIRYPKGKAKITGYAYEPWHIRYVGKGLATYLYENGLTLEEYYNYTPGKDFDFEAIYADLINYTPSVTPLPTSFDDAVLGENGEIIDEGPGGIPEEPAGSDEADTDNDTPDNTETEEQDTSDSASDSEDESTPSEGSDASDENGDTPEGGDTPDNGDTSGADDTPDNGDVSGNKDTSDNDGSSSGSDEDNGGTGDNGSTQEPDSGDATGAETTLTPTPAPAPPVPSQQLH